MSCACNYLLTDKWTSSQSSTKIIKAKIYNFRNWHMRAPQSCLKTLRVEDTQAIRLDNFVPERGQLKLVGVITLHLEYEGRFVE